MGDIGSALEAGVKFIAILFLVFGCVLGCIISWIIQSVL